MTRKFLLSVVISTILFSCGSPNKNKVSDLSEKGKPTDTLKRVDSLLKKTEEKGENESQNLDEYIQITPKSRIEIISFNKMTDTTSRYYKFYKLKCQGWELTKDDIKSILLNSREISSHEHHYNYNIYPCYFYGRFKIDGKLALCEINAGAFCTIEFKDTTVILGYDRSDYKKFFLSGTNPDE